MNKTFFDELNKFKNDYPNANIGDLQTLLDAHNKLICQSNESKIPFADYYSGKLTTVNYTEHLGESHTNFRRIKTNPFDELIFKGLMTQTQFDVLNKVIEDSPFDLIISGSLALLLKGEINRPIGDFDLSVNNLIFKNNFKPKFDEIYGSSFDKNLIDYDTRGKLNITGYQYFIDGVKIDIFPTDEKYEPLGDFLIVKSTDEIWKFKKQIVDCLSEEDLMLTEKQIYDLKKHKADIRWHEEF